MKILYLITQSEWGGAQKYCLDLAENFKNEFEIEFAFGEPGKDGGLAKELDNLNIKYTVLPSLKREISPLNDLRAIFEIKKLIKKSRPDIIHLNSSKISILGSLASISCKSKIIYTVHGWVFKEPLPSFKKLFYKFAEKFTARLKDEIICVSKADYENALYELKIKKEKLSLVHNGLKPIDFSSSEEARAALLSQFNIPESSVLVGAIANLYKTKGLEYLVEAVKLLVDSGINITAIVIGEGKERKNLQDLISQLNIKNRFILAGNVNNAASLLKIFDIYVCSSVKEGLPYSVIEAMFAGLPIVATNVGGIPELIKGEKNGLLVEPADSKLLAEKIKKLLRDEKLFNNISANAKKDAEKKFTFEKMASETKKIYLK